MRTRCLPLLHNMDVKHVLWGGDQWGSHVATLGMLFIIFKQCSDQQQTGCFMSWVLHGSKYRIYLMTCHSKTVIGPAPQAVTKESKIGAGVA